MRRPPNAARLGACLCLLVAACDASVEAPSDRRVCWRMTGPPAKAQFQRLTDGVANLESCAAQLEAVALRNRRPEVVGAYQGQFIFVSPEMIQSSLRLDGARYRVFDADTRAKIDHALRWRLDDEGHASAFAPSSPAAAPTPPGTAPR